MKLDQIKPLLDDPGPFASAYAEVSRAQEDGDTLAELTTRAAYDELVGLGARARPASPSWTRPRTRAWLSARSR